MKIHLLDWRDEAPERTPAEPYLMKVGNVDLATTALEIVGRRNKPVGLIAPYDLANIQHTFSCMATVRDHFPQFPVYAPIPTWTATNKNSARLVLSSVQSAGFDHFIIPFSQPWSFTYHAIWDLLEGAKAVHVAGGDPEVGTWTWSDEQL